MRTVPLWILYADDIGFIKQQGMNKQEYNMVKQAENIRLHKWVESFELPHVPGGDYSEKSLLTISDINTRFKQFKAWAKTQVVSK